MSLNKKIRWLALQRRDAYGSRTILPPQNCSHHATGQNEFRRNDLISQLTCLFLFLFCQNLVRLLSSRPCSACGETWSGYRSVERKGAACVVCAFFQETATWLFGQTVACRSAISSAVIVHSYSSTRFRVSNSFDRRLSAH